MLELKKLVSEEKWDSYTRTNKKLLQAWPVAQGTKMSLAIIQACFQKLPGGDENSESRKGMVGRAIQLLERTKANALEQGRPVPTSPAAALVKHLQKLGMKNDVNDD